MRLSPELGDTIKAPMATCWICGDIANSAEHTIKKMDIKRMFGGGPYPKGQRLLKTTEDGHHKIIQSPDSTHIKYSDVLCHSCNTGRTQPFDRAYDKFMEHMAQGSASVLEKRSVNLRRIYGICGIGQRRNLFNYFVKCFGCRLADSGVMVPTELSASLLTAKAQQGLTLTFSVFEDFLSVSKEIKGVAQVHSLEGEKDELIGENVNFTWALSYGWLTISFWYNRSHNAELGEAWVGDSNKLVLGSFKANGI